MKLIMRKARLKKQLWLRVLLVTGLVFGLFWQPAFVRAQEWATLGDNIYNLNTSNVGIGTASPSQKLVIEGSSGVSGLRIMLNDTDAGAVQWNLVSGGTAIGGVGKFYIRDGSIGANRLTIDTSGNVGIGTTSPAAPLHLDRTNSIGAVNNTNVMTGAALRIGGTPQWAGQILIGSSEGSNYFWYQTGKWDAANGVLNPNYALAINPLGGNVGIGTTTPSATLDVVGNATFSGTVTGGNIQAKYQDVAEWVPAALPIPAGTVLILDTGHSNHVMPSSHAYDIQVAGVVTETPGILLGEGGEGKVKVATTGRVKVKVDASQMPIRIGDLLVTSDKEGIAMRSEPIDFGGIRLHRPGTILGKALESLSEGKGEILVLLTLQ